MEIFCLHTPKTHFSKKGRRKKKWFKLIFDSLNFRVVTRGKERTELNVYLAHEEMV